MSNKWKNLFKGRTTVEHEGPVFPARTKEVEEQAEISPALTINEKVEVTSPYKNVSQPNRQPGVNNMSDEKLIELIEQNEVFRSRVASIIANNSIFISTMVSIVVPKVIEVFQERYDLTPTDTLKQSIKQMTTEAERINEAIASKTQKLEIVENKIAAALENIAPQVSKMLSDVANSVLHVAVTQTQSNTNFPK